MFAGIDIGAKGALCLCLDEPLLYDFKEVGLKGYLEALKEHKPLLIGIEKVSSMPRQGVKSMFSFGTRYGEIIGLLTALSLPFIEIPPKKWRQTLLLPSGATKEDIALKVSSLYKASLYSKRGSLLDGRSDAVAIMHYTKVHYKESL